MPRLSPQEPKAGRQRRRASNIDQERGSHEAERRLREGSLMEAARVVTSQGLSRAALDINAFL